MTKRQICILVLTVIGAMGGVFLGAGADVTWVHLSKPIYIIGSLVSGASAGVAFLSKPPTINQ